jgi:hypothetical protein
MPKWKAILARFEKKKSGQNCHAADLAYSDWYFFNFSRKVRSPMPIT